MLPPANRCPRLIHAAGAAAITFSLALCAAASAQSTPPGDLTYVQNFVETTDGVTTSGVDYVHVSVQAGAAHQLTVVTPSGATHAVALGTRADISAAVDPTAQCYRLSASLLPTAMRIASGTSAQAGQLDVTAGAGVTAIPVSFAAERIAPGLERAFVSGDSAAPIRFTGALDYASGIIMAATFTVATAVGAEPSYVRRCQINLILPKRQQPARVL